MMDKPNRRNETIILFSLFLVAFLVRLSTYNSIFVGNNVRFLEFDPFYHMRRVVSFAENFPNVWTFDTYLDYPYGSVVGWPILYDWTIALISIIAGLGHPSIYTIETIGVYFPAVLGSLSVIAIYFVSKEIFEKETGYIKDKGEELKEKLKEESESKDNKGKEKKKYKKAKKDKIQKKELKIEELRYENWQIGLISGLLLAILPAFVQVSFLGFVDHHVAEVLLSLTAFLFLLKLLKTDNHQKKIILTFATIIFLILAIFSFPDAPIFIGIILIYIVVQTSIDTKYKYLLGIIGALIFFYIVIYLFFHSIYDNLTSGISFLIREGPVLHQIQETQPLFFTFQGIFTFQPSWNAFDTSLYISIIGSIIFSIEVFKNRFKNRLKVFFLVWTCIVLVLNLYQTRFIYLFAVNIIIICSYLIIKLLYSAKLYFKITGVVLLIAIIIPSIQLDNTMVQHPLQFSNDWFNSLEWLKQNTPNPGNWYMPVKGQAPDYGIMTWWDYGNYILYLSQRPVVANNFQLGIEDSTNFFASENVSEANKIMDKRKAKYVIVDYRLGLNVYRSQQNLFIRGAWVSVAILLNKDIRYYLDENNLPNQRYLNTMYSRLYLYDGKGLDNYKLIYKSQTKYTDVFNKPIEEIKIFEYTGKD